MVSTQSSYIHSPRTDRGPSRPLPRSAYRIVSGKLTIAALERMARDNGWGLAQPEEHYSDTHAGMTHLIADTDTGEVVFKKVRPNDWGYFWPAVEGVDSLAAACDGMASIIPNLSILNTVHPDHLQ